MKFATTLVFAGLMAGLAYGADLSEDTEAVVDPTAPIAAVDVNLKDFLWLKRPVVVFADTPADPAFRRQMDLLTSRIDALLERDVVIITDTDPDAMTELREKLRPRGFMMVLIGKDGGVKLRKPAPWNVREISRSIDKMPLRLQELQERRATDG